MKSKLYDVSYYYLLVACRLLSYGHNLMVTFYLFFLISHSHIQIERKFNESSKSAKRSEERVREYLAKITTLEKVCFSLFRNLILATPDILLLFIIPDAF